MNNTYFKIIICILLFIDIPISAQILPEMESFTGKISRPVLSPTGDAVVFSGEDYHGLYLLSNKTKQIKTIANNPGAGYRVSWSNDGIKIGFKLIHANNQQQPVYYDRQKNEIIPLFPISISAGVPTFADSGLITFTIGNKLHVLNSVLQPVFEIDLGSYANLAPISPDGKFVVFNDSNDQLWLLEIMTQIKIPITTGEAGYFNPMWSPDSKKIIFSSLTGYLFVFDTKLANSYLIGRGSSANWLDHGENLVFCDEQWNDKYQIVASHLSVCRYDGANKKLLHEVSKPMVRYVNYAPQIKKMLYISESHLYLEKVHHSGPKIQTELEQDYFIDEISNSINPTKSIQTKPAEFENEIELQSFNAPYLHQVYDTPDWFNGHWACGATSAMMAIAFYEILPEWICNCSSPYQHISKYGRYICEIYSFNNYTYNIGGYDPDGNLGYGGYGYIIQNNWENTKEYMAQYARHHKINSSVDWSPSYAKFSQEMDKRFPVVILNSLTSSGHYILGIGYNSAQRSVVVNDPYGNKNQGYMNYNGKNVVYDWPGYNSGNANLNIVHCLIYMRMDRTDLIPSTFSLTDTLTIGTEVPIQFYVHNNGLIPSDSCSVSIYLSSNQYFDKNDILLRQLPCPSINPGDSLGYLTTVQLPDSLPSAKWAIGVWVDADDSLNEVDELNNLHYEVFVLKGYPLVYGLYPSPDATIGNSRPDISARFKDDYFGIILDSTKFYLDNENITSQSIIDNSKITFEPENDLVPTVHTARIEVTNRPGYRTVGEWQFQIQISAVDYNENFSVVKWSLAQNYPNPFNTDTKIQYQVMNKSLVRIEIFSINGKLVKTLLNEEKNPGNYYCTWNGTDNENQSIASGIYLYRMTGDGFQNTRRMIYLK